MNTPYVNSYCFPCLSVKANSILKPTFNPELLCIPAYTPDSLEL